MPWTYSVAALVHGAAVLGGLFIYTLATHLGRQRRHPSSAIAWVLAIVAFPYAAIPLFLMLGARKMLRPARPPLLSMPAPTTLAPAWAARLSAGLRLPGPRSNRRIAVLEDGPAALEALLALIEQATHSLDLCTFVFADDEVGRRVALALAGCARRGARVRVLLDAIGSVGSSRILIRRLAGTGVQVRRFMPMLHNPLRGRTNLRNHRKLVIADDDRLWSGGRNIAVEYFFDRPGAPAWRDLSFVIEGALAADATPVFERDWRLAGGEPDRGPERRIPAAPPPGNPAQLIASGPDQADDTVYAFLLTAIHQAQATVVAATPYFVPDDALLQALVLACRRGIALTLLLPEHSNHHLADWARARALRELAAAGARILLVPYMLHAKLVVVDETVALGGSVNLDGRSLFLNYELATVFYGRIEVESFLRWFDLQSRHARPYAAQPPSFLRDIAEGVVRAVAFQL